MKRLLAFAFIAAAPLAHADIPIASRMVWSAMGYHRVSYPARRASATLKLSPGRLSAPAVAAPLPWPVKFEDPKHSMGNVMAQYQEYSDNRPYFHGGCDLRTKAGEEIRTPVAGKLAAGHYGYEVNADGSLQKDYAEWPAKGDRMYFELSVTADDGTRYEFHHVDRDALPAPIVEALNRGNARVEAGTLIGRVIYWSARGADGTNYHHTHYNVIREDGLHLNPESVSEPIADTTAPEIVDVLALRDNGKSVRVQEGTRLDFVPKEIIVATTDTKDDDVYVHMPVVTKLEFEDTKRKAWDFRYGLATVNELFPDIRKVFARAVKTPEGKTLTTEGNYGENFFLVRLAMPLEAQGPFTITVEDQAGNRRAVKAALP